MPQVKRIHPHSADERVADLTFSEDSLTVSLMDGRPILRRFAGVRPSVRGREPAAEIPSGASDLPLAWYSRLLHAPATQRAHWKIAGGGDGQAHRGSAAAR